MRLLDQMFSRPHTAPVFVSWDTAVTTYPKLGYLKQKSILSQFQRPEVENQGVIRFGSFWRL